MSVTLSNVDASQLMAMADGLMRVGQCTMARDIYRAALGRAPRSLKTALHIRLGLATHPKPRTLAMLDALQTLERATPGQPVFVGEGLATWFKNMPFMRDERFVALVDKHAPLLPVANWHWNLQTALWAVQQALKVDGDLVELGVFRGHTTLFVAEYLDFATLPRRWRLYDTFEGIPDDQIDAGWADANAAAYKDTFSLEEVQARFEHMPNIDVIRGRVPEVLDEQGPDRIAFIHMDLNNATAEIAALDMLFDRVSSGGVILFDDFGWTVSHAQQAAEVAWFQARGLQILPLPTGQGLFIKS